MSGSSWTSTVSQVSNDGSRHSQAKVLTIFDGVCQACEASPSGLCKLKVTSMRSGRLKPLSTW